MYSYFFTDFWFFSSPSLPLSLSISLLANFKRGFWKEYLYQILVLIFISSFMTLLRPPTTECSSTSMQVCTPFLLSFPIHFSSFLFFLFSFSIHLSLSLLTYLLPSLPEKSGFDPLNAQNWYTTSYNAITAAGVFLFYSSPLISSHLTFPLLSSSLLISSHLISSLLFSSHLFLSVYYLFYFISFSGWALGIEMLLSTRIPKWSLMLQTSFPKV